ncbi:hypothetical protein M427DRAFT_52984 [Gonapodya prolifera JEL478]|uniref:Uncharacterized protein n=1 Tax=Gonapodya prolifera (strain JEL478) TaxID=1344416 RepID=A0A139AS37_GONPJ|nr:hypothetical protein M427DRAFT_52984 [Gonapodya prolifera JEL478]|eukprot:KXS19571.1 hypothetical protein M427DRAFT_52984 [Gonapodya prolifera JEL478]
MQSVSAAFKSLSTPPRNSAPDWSQSTRFDSGCASTALPGKLGGSMSAISQLADIQNLWHINECDLEVSLAEAVAAQCTEGNGSETSKSLSRF